MTEEFGWELIIDLGDCNLETISNGEKLKTFAVELCKLIGMKAYGDPQVLYFGSEIAKGYTLLQLIETSNIIAHFSEKTKAAYINVFSCKFFNCEVAMQFAIHFFGAKVHSHMFLVRNAYAER